MIDTGLKNKVVLITGVNNPHGIGAATAQAFASEGAAVFATYLRLPAEVRFTNVPGEAFYRAQNTKTADEVVTAIRERGGKIEAREADLANPIVSLGAVQTGWLSPELEKQEASHMPLKRVGQPEDVANVIIFFASEQAGWVTGQLLYVGGGHVMPL